MRVFTVFCSWEQNSRNGNPVIPEWEQLPNKRLLALFQFFLFRNDPKQTRPQWSVHFHLLLCDIGTWFQLWSQLLYCSYSSRWHCYDGISKTVLSQVSKSCLYNYQIKIFSSSKYLMYINPGDKDVKITIIRRFLHGKIILLLIKSITESN